MMIVNRLSVRASLEISSKAFFDLASRENCSSCIVIP